MFGSISQEMEVSVPASEAWKVYSTLKLAEIVSKELSNVIQKIEVVEGDGGVGTVLKLTFPPEFTLFNSYKEKFTLIDNEKRVKETEVTEGAYLNMGFNLYRVRLEVIEKGEKACVTRATIEYEIKEEAAANAAMVSIEPLVAIMTVAANYLSKNNV